MMLIPCNFFFFFFNDTATTEIYTLSLHDALPISIATPDHWHTPISIAGLQAGKHVYVEKPDRKSTRLNSSHTVISYAVFCLKKKKNDLSCEPSSSVRHLYSAECNSYRS